MIRFIFRCLLPIVNLKAVLLSIGNIFRYPFFLLDFFRYKISSLNETVEIKDLYPCLSDRSSLSQTGKGHYFYQDTWALEKVFKNMPNKHIDVGSRIDGFVGQCSSFCEVEFVDLRPVDLGLSKLKMVEGNILNLPYENNSVESLSSLHVIEHIGLGRYGDQIDFDGSKKALKELQRIMKVNGYLYLGVPVGRERVMFNAHRVHFPKTIIKNLDQCELQEFSVVDDAGKFIQNVNPDEYDKSDYACGLFVFKKVRV